MMIDKGNERNRSRERGQKDKHGWQYFSSHLGGDMATTRRYLDMASRATSILDQSNGQIPAININCLDPLGRNALLIGSGRSDVPMLRERSRLFFF